MSERKLTWPEVLVLSSRNEELFEHYCYLQGYTPPQTPVDIMVDQASGRLETIAAGFVQFIRDSVWDRLPPEVKIGDATL